MRIFSLDRHDDGVQPTLIKALKPHSSPVVVTCIDGSNTLIATGGADGVVKVWDIARGYLTHTFHGHSGIISALHFFLDQTKICLASGGEDGLVRVWSLAPRKSLALLESHTSVVRSLAYSPASRTLLSASRDKTVILWAVASWSMKNTIPVLEVVEAAGFLQNERLLHTGGEHGRIRLWDVQKGTELTRPQQPADESESIIQTIFRNNQILSIHTNHLLVLHSCQDTSADPLPIVRHISGTHDEIIDLAFVSPDASLLALATNTLDVQLINNNDSAYLGANVASLKGHTDIVISLAVDPSGEWLASGAKDNTARIWRINHQETSYDEWAVLTGHAESVGCLTFSGQMTLLTGSQDRTIKKWTIPKTAGAAAKAIYTRKAHEKDINALALSPSGQQFVTASQDRSIKVWSTEEGETMGVLRGHKRGVWSAVFSPKGTSMINRDDGQTGNRGYLLSSSGDKTVKIWSLFDYSCIRTFEGHSDSVLKAIWLAPDHVASAGSDGLVKVWDCGGSDCLATLDNHTDRVWALAQAPNSTGLVSGAADGVITFWKDTTKETAEASSQANVERVEQDQHLQNCLRDGQYREAIVLALQLNHPARLLSVFQAALDTQEPEPGTISGNGAVDAVVGTLSDEQLLLLLGKLRDWNTNVRTAAVAQRVLHIVVDKYSAVRLAGLGKRKGGKDIVEALRAYTERHYRRIEELWEESFLVEYLLGEMNQVGVRDSSRVAT